jgi:TonB-linked SusC/RagA family outer membrane protein
MKIKLLLLLFLFFGGISSMYAQRVITGNVADATDGSSLPGVNVIVQGTTQGTTTDMNGHYAITVNDNTSKILVFSFVGYETQKVDINGRTRIDVKLKPASVALNQVIVTALGISKAKKSLAYSAEQVKGDEVTAVKNPSVMTSLSGKVTGLTVNESGSGVGGSVRVTLRGNKSTRNNQPLYVIDGVPMLNYSPQQPNDPWGGGNASGAIGVDGGDALSSINPDDIQSITVLKGASAAALYGSQAANGAILITTKKGKAGKGVINFTSTFTANTISTAPEFQFKYGQTSPGALDSWGSKLGTPAPDHIADFFNTGSTAINAVSFSGGTKNSQTYISYANTLANGIMPENRLARHNFKMNENATFFKGKLEVNADLNYLHQKIKNDPALGLYYNPLTGLYFFPRGKDFNEYKDHFEIYSSQRNMMVQNWFADKDDQQNPYWIVHRDPNFTKRDRFFVNAGLKLHIIPGLDLIARGNVDKSFDVFDQRSYASTQATLADPNGRYVLSKTEGTQLYGDVLLNYQYQNKKVSVNANLGGSIRDVRIYNEFFDSKGADLKFANIFSLQNFKQPGANIRQSLSRRQLQSVYGSAQFGYRGYLYVNVTGRNDWSSTLPDQSYFYPSVGVSAIVSQMVDMKGIDFLKVRVSYAIVGNDVDPYVANMINRIDPVSGLVTNTLGLLPGKKLLPEKSKSFETGFDIRVLKNRLRFNFTYYNTHTENQFIRIAAPMGSGYSQYLVNAGDIQNKGVEAMLGFTPVKTGAVTWDADFNFTKNVNKVLHLSKDLPNGIYYLTPPGVNNYGMALTEGGSFGDIYGKKFKRAANGDIIVDANGRPLAEGGGLGYVGNPEPDFMLSWNNTISWKRFSFRVLIDGRFGGKVMSLTQAVSDLYGVTKVTADARDNGGVDIHAQLENGTPYSGKIDPHTFYTTVGGRAGITEYYMYDATNIRLREFSIAYHFKIKSNVVKGLKLSFVARNLFFFMNNAPFDPDVTMSTGTSFQGVDVFSPPSTRSFGLNLNLTL